MKINIKKHNKQLFILLLTISNLSATGEASHQPDCLQEIYEISSESLDSLVISELTESSLDLSELSSESSESSGYEASSESSKLSGPEQPQALAQEQVKAQKQAYEQATIDIYMEIWKTKNPNQKYPHSYQTLAIEAKKEIDSLFQQALQQVHSQNPPSNTPTRNIGRENLCFICTKPNDTVETPCCKCVLHIACLRKICDKAKAAGSEEFGCPYCGKSVSLSNYNPED